MMQSELTSKKRTDTENESIDDSPGREISEQHVQQAKSPDVQMPEDIADRYTFCRLLGRGNQGSVYEAVRRSDSETVAIKVLQINSIKNWKEYDLFWREADTLKSLDIPGIARFHEVIECLDDASPHAYLVQQRIRGKSLDEMIHEGHRFTFQDIFSFAIQLLDILEQLHHHDPPIIHRDIKPSNIVLEPDGSQYRVYLTDFGAVCNPLLQRGGSTIAGTYGYMPPEQLMGNVCAASDIYALGVTITELLSGISPADMDVVDFRLAIEKPLENVPYEVVSLLRQMTSPNTDDRLCDYAQIKRKFQDFRDNRFESSNTSERKRFNLFKYTRKLRKVQRIGQKGNMDLWLQLPEQTPRPLPQCYKKLKPSGAELLSAVLYYVNYLFSPLNLIKHPGYYALAWLICYLVVAMVCLGIMMIIPLMIVLAIIIRDHNNDIKENAMKAESIQNLVREGKKALATVVDCKFVNGRDDGIACFELSYTFHVADFPEENLVHTVSTPYDPFLKPGDVLPILYDYDPPDNDPVANRANNPIPNHIYIKSMPFPLPAQNLAPLNECYGYSWIGEG
jgi:serine/threonine protein kinase